MTTAALYAPQLSTAGHAADRIRSAFLMCPPDYYDTSFLFNSWMTYREEVDRHKAKRQWSLLRDTLVRLGARVHVVEPLHESPAMVFTADGALACAPGRAVILRNDGWRSFFEAEAFSYWFRGQGVEVEKLPPGYHIDGGNLVRLSSISYLIGLKPGSLGKAERYMGKLLNLVAGARVRPLALRERRFLHLDMAVGNLGGGRGLLVYWDALHPVSRDYLKQSVEVPIISVCEQDAVRFACNCITVNGTVITGPISSELRAEIEAQGLEVLCIDLSEFYKAGGGAKCLTLPITHPY